MSTAHTLTERRRRWLIKGKQHPGTYLRRALYVHVRPRTWTYVDVRPRTSTYVDVSGRTWTYVDARARNFRSENMDQAFRT